MQKPKSVVDKNINTENFNHEKNLDYVSNIQTLGDSVQQDTSMDSQVIAYHCRFCGESVNYPSRQHKELYELYELNIFYRFFDIHSHIGGLCIIL